MTKSSLMNARIDRRRLVVATSGAMIAAPFLGSGLTFAAQDGSGVTVTMVTDTAGIGDQGFNDLANKGGTEAVAEYKIKFNVIESQTAADYVPNLTQGAENSQLTAAIGFLLTDAMAEVAPTYPDSKFMILDAVVEGDNVASVTFKENEGTFLAGVLAALTTKTGKIGFVGGIRIPPVERYEVGYVAGARSINPDIEIQIAYADSFEDPALGKELALAQFNQGSDVLQQAAGRTGVGLFDAAKEKGAGFWVISGDADQAHLGPEIQLAAVQKGIDTAVKLVIKEVIEDQFKAGVQNLGVKEGGMDLVAFNTEVTAEIKAIVESYKTAIADGKFEVPNSDDALKAFKPVPPSEVGASASPVATPVATPVG
ncbi:MAG: BMP family lipoprotein [Thermomicrobiales bacterium]